MTSRPSACTVDVHVGKDSLGFFVNARTGNMNRVGILVVHKREVDILDFERLAEWAGRAARRPDR